MILVQRFGMTWAETGRLRLGDYDTMMAVLAEMQKPDPAPRDPPGRRGGGVTRTPIVSS